MTNTRESDVKRVCWVIQSKKFKRGTSYQGIIVTGVPVGAMEYSFATAE